MKRKTGSVMDLSGILKYGCQPVTVEQMNEAIADSRVDDDERIKREYREYMESEKQS